MERPTALKSYQIFLILLGVALLANVSSLFSGPFWDDYQFLFSNPGIVENTNPFAFWIKGSGFERIWSLGYSQFWFLFHIFKHNYWGYKLTSICFHTLNALLLYRLAKRWNFKYAIWAVCIFLLHPIQVETLSWIFQLNTIVATTWALGTTLLIQGLIVDGEFKLRSKGEIAKLILAFLMFYLSLKTKPVAVMLPLATVFTLKLKNKKMLLGAGAVVLVLVVIGGWIALKSNNAITNSTYENSIRKTYFFDELFGRIAFGPSVTSIEGDLAYHTFMGKNLLKLNLMSRNFWFYVSKFLMPTDLMFMYPSWRLSPVLGAMAVAGFISVCFLGLVLGLKSRSRQSLIPLFIIFAGFLPISGIIYVPYMKFSFVADHWAYVMLIGMSLVAVQLIEKLELKLSQKSLQSVLIIFLMFLAYNQTTYSKLFNSTEEMLERNIAENPGAGFLYEYLARIYKEKNNHPKAREYLKLGLKVNPASQVLNQIKMELDGNSTDDSGS